jgi:hypothetical protein
MKLKYWEAFADMLSIILIVQAVVWIVFMCLIA